MQGGGGDSQSLSGAVELREDVPLKAGGGEGGGSRCCVGGPRLVIACFAALTAAITLALFTQIYYGDYEVVPHGSVSSSAALCSRVGTDALKERGRALDAAAAAALCLAVVAPHRTSLDASGSLLYWEYRQSRTQKPTLAEWGGLPPTASAGVGAGTRPPRLVAALAALHAELGALPWSRLLQPAIDLARSGFVVSESLAYAQAAAVAASEGSSNATSEMTSLAAGTLTNATHLVAFLESLQLNTSAELTAAWGISGAVRKTSPQEAAAGAVRVYAGGAFASAALRALALALHPPPVDLDDASRRVVAALQPVAAELNAGSAGVATGLAVIDSLDTYVALVTGLSAPFGSGPDDAAGWTRDEPTGALDLAPAFMVDGHVCGTRYVVGAESGAALAQVGAGLGAGGAGGAAAERARVEVRGGALQAEARVGTQPCAACAAVNFVQQTGDALMSHADSRGGGLASRY